MPDDILTTSEAAHYLQVSRQTVERWVWLKRLIPHGITERGMMLFLRRDLDSVRPAMLENKARYKSDEAAQKRRKKPEGE